MITHILVVLNNLENLIAKWNQRAGRAFEDAQHEKSKMGKQLIEHGAMIYFNCTNDLKEALLLDGRKTSTTPSEHQK